jgi:PAS domain S-box-containing protein
MSDNSESYFSNIQHFFSSGTIVLFTCAREENFPLLSVSKNAGDILGFDASYFEENKHGWSDRIHPDDRERVYAHFRRIVAEGGSAVVEYRFKRKQGSYIWLRDEIKLVEQSGEFDPLIYGASIDITDRKEAEIALEEHKAQQIKQENKKREQAEKKLKKQLAYEKAISNCSNLLLAPTSSDALRESLEMLREVTEADRVYIYKNEEKQDGLYLKPEVEVLAEGINTELDPSERKFKYAEVPWWHEKLSNNEIIREQSANMPDPERSILEEQKVQSVLVIPITVNEDWYGYVGFADSKGSRSWRDDEVSLLKTAADIIAAHKKRKTIEKSLVQQRNYTQTILDSLPSIYMLLDENLGLVQWNKNAEEYTGYSADELHQKTAFDLIISEDHEKLKENTQRANVSNNKGVELRLQKKSGELALYYWRGHYLEFDQQEYFLCLGVDISKQKQTERELMSEKQFNEALIESLPGIFYMIDSEGNYQQWNKNFVEELGYSSGEIEDMTPADFYTEQEYERIKAGIQEVFETGEAQIETEIITKEGKKIPYYLTGKLLTRNGDNYLVGVGHDISEQVEARNRLKRSEQLFRNLFLKAPAAIVMVDPDSKILNVNESFEDLFGYTEEELEGCNIDETIVPEDEYEDAPKMSGKKFAMDNFHKEAKRVHKDGTLIDVFVAAIPVYVDGEPLAGFGMYIDISEQKKYEQEIYRSLKEKHLLLKEIHHRVKNNLAVVSGLLQLQMYETDDPVVRETLQESESRIQTMALIHEKLYNSQNLSHISCKSYIGELIETIQNSNDSAKNISVVTDIADMELNINKAVPFALLVNEAVTNSFKHAFEDQDEGTIRINVECNDDQISARITDNGRGLPEEFDINDKESLGMTLIENFAQQLEAEWELGSDNGVYVEVEFTAESESEERSEFIEL